MTKILESASKEFGGFKGFLVRVFVKLKILHKVSKSGNQERVLSASEMNCRTKSPCGLIWDVKVDRVVEATIHVELLEWFWGEIYVRTKLLVTETTKRYIATASVVGVPDPNNLSRSLIVDSDILNVYQLQGLPTFYDSLTKTTRMSPATVTLRLRNIPNMRCFLYDDETLTEFDQLYRVREQIISSLQSLKWSIDSVIAVLRGDMPYNSLTKEKVKCR